MIPALQRRVAVDATSVLTVREPDAFARLDHPDDAPRVMEDLRRACRAEDVVLAAGERRGTRLKAERAAGALEGGQRTESPGVEQQRPLGGAGEGGGAEKGGGLRGDLNRKVGGVW